MNHIEPHSLSRVVPIPDDDHFLSDQKVDKLIDCIACLGAHVEIDYDPADEIITAKLVPHSYDDLSCVDEEGSSCHLSFPLAWVVESGRDQLVIELICGMNLPVTEVGFAYILDKSISHQLLELADRCESHEVYIEDSAMVAALKYFRDPIAEILETGELFAIGWKLNVTAIESGDDELVWPVTLQ